MIRKVGGKYVLYSIAKNPRTANDAGSAHFERARKRYEESARYNSSRAAAGDVRIL